MVLPAKKGYYEIIFSGIVNSDIHIINNKTNSPALYIVNRSLAGSGIETFIVKSGVMYKEALSGGGLMNNEIIHVYHFEIKPSQVKTAYDGLTIYSGNIVAKSRSYPQLLPLNCHIVGEIAPTSNGYGSVQGAGTYFGPGFDAACAAMGWAQSNYYVSGDSPNTSGNILMNWYNTYFTGIVSTSTISSAPKPSCCGTSG